MCTVEYKSRFRLFETIPLWCQTARWIRLEEKFAGTRSSHGYRYRKGVAPDTLKNAGWPEPDSVIKKNPVKITNSGTADIFYRIPGTDPSTKVLILCRVSDSFSEEHLATT